MDLRMLSSLLVLRSRWKQRDGWSGEQLFSHQNRALGRLRRHAYAHSRFYREHHAGLREAPLHALPPVTKAELMASFDEAVTDPRLHLADVEAHLADLVSSGGIPDGRGKAGGGQPRPPAPPVNAASSSGTAVSGPPCSPPTPEPTTGPKFPLASRAR